MGDDRRRRLLESVRISLWADREFSRRILLPAAALLGLLQISFGVWIVVAGGHGQSGVPPTQLSHAPRLLGVFMLVIGAAFTGPAILRRFIGPPRWRDWLAECRLCPVCGYDLIGLPTQPDGCLVCPECGAAWRVGEAGRHKAE